MPRRLNILQQVRVPQPCAAEWDTMRGNEQVRFCEHCAKHVHNLSAMTPARAMKLVEASNGKLCVRYYVRRDGAPQTYKPGLVAPPSRGAGRAARLATGAFSAVLSLSAHIAAQTATSNTFAPFSSAAVRTEAARPKTTATGGATLTGLVNAKVWEEDADEAKLGPVAGARVRLLDRTNNREIKGFSDETGAFKLTDVPSGTYRLLVKAGGFDRYKEEITITSGEARRVSLELKPTWYIGGAMGGEIGEAQPPSPLFRAIEAKDAAQVRDILARDKSAVNLANPADYSGATPLMTAVEKNSPRIVQLLLEAGANPNQLDKLERSPLMWVDDDTRPALVRLLLQYGAEVNYRRKSDQTTPFIELAETNPAIVKMLLEAGAELNAYDEDGKTALMAAADRKDWDVVRFLLDAGADFKARDDAGHSALEYAAKTNELDGVKMLLAAGADATSVDEDGNAIWQLLDYGTTPEIVEFWLAAKIDLEHRNDAGQTWLHLLSQPDKPECVRLLLKAGADINARDKRGWTPLIQATDSYNAETVKSLLQAGAEVNLRNHEGFTALHYAGEDADNEVRKLLLAHGATE